MSRHGDALGGMLNYRSVPMDADDDDDGEPL